MNIALPHWEYLILNLLVFIPTFTLVIFHPKNLLKAKLFNLIIAVIVTGLLFLIWDIYATFSGHWQFNDQFILGLKFLELPLEEYLFFITVPFSCLFVWDEFKNFESWSKFFTKLRGI